MTQIPQAGFPSSTSQKTGLSWATSSKGDKTAQMMAGIRGCLRNITRLYGDGD